MHSGGFDDHTAILDKFLDMCARVGVADFCLLSGIEPDFTFADAGDACGEAFLRAEIDCEDEVDISKIVHFCKRV